MGVLNTITAPLKVGMTNLTAKYKNNPSMCNEEMGKKIFNECPAWKRLLSWWTLLAGCPKPVRMLMMLMYFGMAGMLMPLNSLLRHPTDSSQFPVAPAVATAAWTPRHIIFFLVQ